MGNSITGSVVTIAVSGPYINHDTQCQESERECLHRAVISDQSEGTLMRASDHYNSISGGSSGVFSQ